MNTVKDTIIQKISIFAEEGSLAHFISWLDIETLNNPEETLYHELLARSVVALGCEFVEKQNIKTDHPVINTIKSAEEYALNPTEENWEQLYESSTNSYPFGPGEGCYDIKIPGYKACSPGTGCKSGAGSLEQIRVGISGMSEKAAMLLISEELLRWLRQGS